MDNPRYTFIVLKKAGLITSLPIHPQYQKSVVVNGHDIPKVKE